MSHFIPVPSRPGTALADRTVGELVAERPGRSRLFQQAGIDFCCQGGRTLRQSCERNGVSLDLITRQLAAEQSVPVPPGIHPARLAPAALVDHLVARHHAYLWRELPRLLAMARRVAEVHGGHTPALLELETVFDGLQEELTVHLMREEQVLFPAIRELVAGGPPLPIEGPLDCLTHEHEAVGQALGRLRTLSYGFQAPPDACNTYRALFAGLLELEADLHEHIHLENAVLFPAAVRLVAERRADESGPADQASAAARPSSSRSKRPTPAGQPQAA